MLFMDTLISSNLTWLLLTDNYLQRMLYLGLGKTEILENLGIDPQ